MSTTLVTGGAGFIGSHVADELLRAGHEVIILDDLSGGSADNVPAGARFVHGSVCDPGTVNGLFRTFGFDYVFHLAAFAAVGLSHFAKRLNYTTNVIGSVNLINAAINTGTVRCFVFTSSISVYGGADRPIDDSHPPEPEDSYGIAKYMVEQELRVSREVFGLPYIIFRPHNVYGERQNLGDRYRNVIGIFINRALRGEPFPVFGDGEQTRAFTYIDDVAPLIARSLSVPAAYQRTMNIGGDTGYTVNQLAHSVAEALGVPASIEYLPARPEARNVIAGHRVLREVFGPAPQPVPLKEGLAHTAAWAIKQGPREPSLLPGIEIERDLPASWRPADRRPSPARPARPPAPTRRRPAGTPGR